MNILITGAAGQLGHELIPQLSRLGRVSSVDREPVAGDPRAQSLDLSQLNQVEIFLNRTRPDLVVNAAAYTAVDGAESDTKTAFRINAELPACLARWCERNDRFLVHYSTDYVFPGEPARPFLESDPTGPLNVYGESKLAGEWAIQSAACLHLILRTSWVYSAHGNNFVLTMLRLARERPQLSIVSDQIGCPTWARNLASVSTAIVQRFHAGNPGDFPGGLYHYCDRDAVSWHDFAVLIFTVARRLGLLDKLPEIKPVKTSEFPLAAERPLYSVLDTSIIQTTFGIDPAGLEASLESCLEESLKSE